MKSSRARVGVAVALLAALIQVHTNASSTVTLLEAIRQDDESAVTRLVRAGADVNLVDGSGATPLMHAALLAGPRVVQRLLDGGAAVNVANRFGATPLMWAVSQPENVEVLLRHGANVNARASNGWTALSAAARQSQIESMRMLLAAGADVTSPDARKQVLTASFQASSPAVRKLLKDAGLVVRSPADVAGPVLSRARDDIHSLRHLLDVGLDPKESLQTITIAIPTFFLAARDGQLEAVQALVQHGMDPDFVGARGTTALTLAAGADRPSHAVIRFLLEQGADINRADSDGRTPLDWALTRGETETAALLRGMGGRTGAPAVPTPRRTASPLPPRQAVERALARLQPAGRAFTDKARCTSCHNEYIPGIAVALARKHGVVVNEPLAANSVAMTEQNFERRRELTLLGDTAPLTGIAPGLAYGLLERSTAGLAMSVVTEGMAIALANRQGEDGSWDAGEGIRPPLNGNVIANTALAVRVLREFAPAGRRTAFARRVTHARSFLSQMTAVDTQDQAFKLLGLIWAGASARDVSRERQRLIDLQRQDGGWGQMPTLASDAYATGQALYALQQSGMSARESVYRRGTDFLLRTQLEDGTWFVRTRAFGVQPYFETGFPHGPSQFISATATAWAAIALAQTLP